MAQTYESLPDFGSPDEWFRALAIIEDDDGVRARPALTVARAEVDAVVRLAHGEGFGKSELLARTLSRLADGSFADALCSGIISRAAV
jgi:hypothetical protein